MNCTVQNCDKPNRAHGMCAMHNERYRRHGSVDTVLKAHKREGCLVDGCDGKHRANGYCTKHATNVARLGKPISPRTRDRTEGERFWSFVKPTGFCWEWAGHRNHDGYGIFTGNVPAYRKAYEMLVGPIPDGLEMDHLCRNRACINPDHLEPVTHAVNTLRGYSISGLNARKTHCGQGHEFTAENTYVFPDGRRTCRVCARRWRQEYARRKRLTG